MTAAAQPELSDHDRINAALSATKSAVTGVWNRHPDTVHNPHPNDLVRARQLVDAAIAVLRAATCNVMAPLEIRTPLDEGVLIEDAVGHHAHLVADMLPPGADTRAMAPQRRRCCADPQPYTVAGLGHYDTAAITVCCRSCGDDLVVLRSLS